ncbi:flagellar protein FlaG [Paenibacillus oryzisoli]|uniref:Flagellar biosynthesis protein FlaG n=1 Tax=Paenibacillus oryzisoli TaxID=1850517 RepID=A0A197ZZ58_9BACL|nr:flagellar protein FlaG [Paenibacillus oryzisoli]OAS14494.1 flagellar biosynthesis protein FlaG [Paenibacillus oryzisoli]
MSINNPVSGFGIPGDSRPSPEPVKVHKVDEIGTSNAAAIIASNFTNTSDLRQAEMQGENVTISDAQVVKAIEHAIKAMQGRTTSLEFSIHQKTKLISVKVLDKDTGETIREIPPEKSLDFVAKLWKMAGILVDEKR